MLLPPETQTTPVTFPRWDELSASELARLDSVLRRAAERIVSAWAELAGLRVGPLELAVRSGAAEPAGPAAANPPTVGFGADTEHEAYLVWSPAAAGRLVSDALCVPRSAQDRPLSPVESAILVALSRAAVGACRAARLLLTAPEQAALAGGPPWPWEQDDMAWLRLVITQVGGSEPLAILATRATHVRRAALTPARGAGKTLSLAALTGCRIALTACFGQVRVPFRDLLRLRPGDVITLDQDSEAQVYLHVGGRAKFLGQAGVEHARLAVRIRREFSEQQSRR